MAHFIDDELQFFGTPGVGGTLPAAPTASTSEFLISPDTDGYPLGSDGLHEYKLYSHNATGFSLLYAAFASLQFNRTDHVLTGYAIVPDATSSFTTSKNFRYTVQPRIQDSVPTVGYAQTSTMDISIDTTVSVYENSVSDTASGYNPGTSIVYRVWGNWNIGGTEYLSHNYVELTNAVPGGFTKGTFTLNYEPAGAVQEPQNLYVERNVNGAGFTSYARVTYYDTFTDDNGATGVTWTATPFTNSGNVPLAINLTANSFFTTLDYNVDRYDLDLLTHKHQVISNTLANGCVDKDTGWTAGAATFQDEGKYMVKLDWSNNTAGTYVRLLKHLYIGNDELYVYDYFVETAVNDTTYTDNYTSWTQL